MMISVKDSIRKMIEFARTFVKTYETDIASPTVDAILINVIKYAAFWGYGAKVSIDMDDIHNSNEIDIRILNKESDVPVDTSYIPFKLRVGGNMLRVHDNPFVKIDETMIKNGYDADTDLSKVVIVRVLTDYINFVKENIS